MSTTISRELLVHRLYEAAELEHNLMCTYLYAAFSLRQGTDEGLTPTEADATARWRKEIIAVAVEEMAHLAAVWNITSALGGAPRFGRFNFPLDPGILPASITVKLAPFTDAVIQHFVHLERPTESEEPEGEGFEPMHAFTRTTPGDHLTPMALDYPTVGVFYAMLEDDLRAFVAEHGEAVAFCGDPQLQLGPTELALDGVKPVVCLKTALAALTSIVEQGEGAPSESDRSASARASRPSRGGVPEGDAPPLAKGSHHNRFVAIREELKELRAHNPSFHPAFPAATNPVLRRPVTANRVWLEDAHAVATVDCANTGYALMLRLLAYSYGITRGAEKGLAVGLAIDLMRAVTLLGERAARLPAGPSNPECHAGMSFTALRDAAALPQGVAARRFFVERFEELAAVAAALDETDPRASQAAKLLTTLAARAKKSFAGVVTLPIAVVPPPAPPPTAAPHVTATADVPRAPNGAPIPRIVNGVEELEAEHMTMLFDQKKCIHSRHCVTEAPQVFLANVEGPWIVPDAMDVESLVGIAHVCPSGAIRYRRKDGHQEEQVPPVNLVAIREGGPYAVRAEIHLDGDEPKFFRATLCRCGASKNKPFCDGSHHTVHFAASGEPETIAEKSAMLAVRNGPLAIDPQPDGPLQVRGNLEITSGTGRMVARIQSAKLCRCGGSASKPFCDGTHQRNGFRS